LALRGATGLLVLVAVQALRRAERQARALLGLREQDALQAQPKLARRAHLGAAER
jgi:hypothetical protein